jgi:nicotinate-nucleotide adenylyltransferase
MLILFGGSFNPPHIGHKIIAEIAYDEFKPEKFIIMPSPTPPHKTIEHIADYTKRYLWCKDVFNDNYFEVSNLEAILTKPSYTVKTIEYLFHYYKVIYLLIGEDSLINFKKWYKWEDILKKAKLIVYPRYFTEKKNYVDNVEHIMLQSPIIDISSTLIRERIKNGKTVKGMVDDKIIDEVKSFYSYYNL